VLHQVGVSFELNRQILRTSSKRTPNSVSTSTNFLSKKKTQSGSQ